MIRYEETAFDGVWQILSAPVGDTRGSFARLFCDVTHRDVTGKNFIPVQINRSVSALKGTLRGMHFQHPPALESKIMRCTRGRVLDVVVDLRLGSRTFLQHLAVELSAEANNALVIPAGFAHGFQTLEADCEMLYLHNAPYAKEHEDGLLHDDPLLKIIWPLPVSVLSDRDRGFKPLSEDFKGIAV